MSSCKQAIQRCTFVSVLSIRLTSIIFIQMLLKYTFVVGEYNVDQDQKLLIFTVFQQTTHSGMAE